MTGSMYAAVSGLKAHMSALNVIGNNVANVNTLGYKTTRYTFNEALYTTQISGSDGTNTAGGRNPAQVGFGASIGTIDLDMSTKNYSPTGHGLDCMIDGDGFFFVGDKQTAAGTTAIGVKDTTTLKGMDLSRLGNFEVDPNGYLVDGNGSVVWGFLEQAVTEPTKNDAGVYSVVPSSSNVKGDYVEVTDSTTNEVTRYRVFTFTETSGTTTTTTYKYLTQLTEEDVETLKKRGVQLNNVEYQNVKETVNQQEVTVARVKSATMTVGDVMSAIRLPTYQVDTSGNKTVSWPKYEAEHTVTRTTTDANNQEVTTTTTVPAEMKDTATLRVQSDSTTIDPKSGALTIMTNDGTLYTVGYLAIGKVTNPNGVTHVDGRYYQALDGAGTIRVTSLTEIDGVESAGDTGLLTGGLESSGTDLATEITNMITVQRGYQANTRIVTVTDSMLEELVNMKR